MYHESTEALTPEADPVGPGVIMRRMACVLIILTGIVSSPGSYGEVEEHSEVGQKPTAVSFTVGAREGQLYYFPCADCHDYMDSNTRVRELEVEEGHPEILNHGDGQMWCFACHDPSNYGQLLNLLSAPIDFDNGYRVCSGCHSKKYRDWTHGGHGKRLANWLGERQLYSCVECHNPHRPAIAPRAPQPPPPIRAGLEPMAPYVVDEPRSLHRPLWEQIHGQ